MLQQRYCRWRRPSQFLPGLQRAPFLFVCSAALGRLCTVPCIFICSQTAACRVRILLRTACPAHFFSLAVFVSAWFQQVPTSRVHWLHHLSYFQLALYCAGNAAAWPRPTRDSKLVYTCAVAHEQLCSTEQY